MKKTKIKGCSWCKIDKPLDNFHKDKSRPDGLYPYCKPCMNDKNRNSYIRHKDSFLKTDRKYRKNNPEKVKEWSDRKRKKYPTQTKAVYTLNNALRSGKVTKKPCRVCGESKSQGHHEDYSKPLDVIWLCDYHHKLRHGRIITFTPPKKHGKK